MTDEIEKEMEENFAEDIEEIVADAEDEAPRELTVEEQLADALAESAENRDNWHRAVAELVNARKRFEKLQGEARLNARIKVATDLLPILDDFGLVMENTPDTIKDDEWYKGLALLPKKMNTILDKLNIEPIASVGEEFDPAYHNAIMREESDDHESGIVIKEFQAGYKVGEQIIRPALVVVSA